MKSDEPVLVSVEPDAETMRSLKSVGHVSYLLHAIVAVGAVLPGTEVSVTLLVVAFLIDVLKKDAAIGSWQASHFRWRIRSVLWAGGLYVLTFPLFFLFILPGKLAWLLISLWFAYRILRGWMALDGNRPIAA